MCLAIPAKIIAVAGEFATVDMDGVKKEVCMALLDDSAVGDYVLVHAGFAISKLDIDEARRTLELFGIQ